MCVSLRNKWERERDSIFDERHDDGNNIFSEVVGVGDAIGL